MPALHIKANPFNDREGRFDNVGAGQGQSQLLRNVEPMDCQRFLQPFRQAAGRAGIEMHQLVMQPFERLPGGGVIFERVSGIQFPGDRRFLLIR